MSSGSDVSTATDLLTQKSYDLKKEVLEKTTNGYYPITEVVKTYIFTCSGQTAHLLVSAGLIKHKTAIPQNVQAHWQEKICDSDCYVHVLMKSLAKSLLKAEILQHLINEGYIKIQQNGHTYN